MSLSALLCACSETSQPENSPPPSHGGDSSVGTRPAGEPRLITVEGRIATGIECPIIETPEGEIYSVSLGAAEFGPGDYVRFTGELADASFCQQGKGTLIADTIVAIDPPARDRDPARAGGISLNENHLSGSWVAKGMDANCDDPDFRIADSPAGLMLKGTISGHGDAAPVVMGEYPRLDLDEPSDDLPIETRGPDGLAILRPATDAAYDPIAIGNAVIEADGAVFVKCG